MPRSRELYKIKKKKRKGGQVGHKGNYRAKMEADKIVNCPILANAEEKLQYVCIHQNSGNQALCSRISIRAYQKCGKRKSSKLPEGVTPDTFGPNQ